MDLELSTETREDGVAVVKVAGEVSVYNYGRLRELLIELTQTGCCRIVLDLAGCEFLDASGLGAIVGALKRCRAFNGGVAVARPDERVAKLFRITGLTKVFGMHATVDDAAQSLLAGAP